MSATTSSTNTSTDDLSLISLKKPLPLNTFEEPPTLTDFSIYTELTTVFTPPPGCWSGAWTLESSGFGIKACTRTYASSCFPNEYASLGKVLYSPGACPQGYTPDEVFTNKGDQEVTSCICCPERMTFNLDATNRKGPITDATKLIVEGRTTRNTDTILGMAPLMLVAWQSGNLPYFTPPSVPLLQVLAATSMSASPTSANASTAIASQNTVNPSANGLAQEAKIGIGVGTGCGVLLVCASIGLLVYRRRLRRSHEKVDETQPAGKAEGGGVVPKAELAGDSHVREIDGRQTVAETDGANVRHELEGDWHGYEVRAT